MLSNPWVADHKAAITAVAVLLHVTVDNPYRQQNCQKACLKPCGQARHCCACALHLVSKLYTRNDSVLASSGHASAFRSITCTTIHSTLYARYTRQYAYLV